MRIFLLLLSLTSTIAFSSSKLRSKSKPLPVIPHLSSEYYSDNPQNFQEEIINLNLKIDALKKSIEELIEKNNMGQENYCGCFSQNFLNNVVRANSCYGAICNGLKLIAIPAVLITGIIIWSDFYNGLNEDTAGIFEFVNAIANTTNDIDLSIKMIEGNITAMEESIGEIITWMANLEMPLNNMISLLSAVCALPALNCEL